MSALITYHFSSKCPLKYMVKCLISKLVNGKAESESDYNLRISTLILNTTETRMHCNWSIWISAEIPKYCIFKPFFDYPVLIKVVIFMD
jgi:hypothetical protein